MLHSVTTNTSKRIRDSRIPIPLAVFFALPGVFTFFSSTGARYLSAFFTIGFSR